MRTGRVSAASDPLPPDMVERFSASLARLNPAGGKIGLAVSGGPDSMAMLLLAHAAIPGRFAVATVDHGLRAEAADECALVERACGERGVACDVLKVTVEAGNVQAEAREARYEALKEWARRHGWSAIATAHHTDDQAETLLMRLNRGSGLAGLGGIREFTVFWPNANRSAKIIRPLLGWRRAELGAIVQHSGIETVADPSNLNDSYDRVRLRKQLAGADWIDPSALAASAKHLLEAQDALDWCANSEWHRGVQLEEGFVRYFAGCHPLIEKEVLLRIFAHLGKQISRTQADVLFWRLVAGQNGSLAGILVTSATVEIVDNDGRSDDAPCWLFRPEPPRRN